jgi:hypothetical protein
MLGIDGVADTALDFHTEDERMQKRRARYRPPLREREDRRRDRAARMDDRLQVRIVEIERMRRDPVHERRMHDVEPVCASEDGGFGLAGKRRERGERALDGLVAAPADRAAEPVEKRARRLVAYLLRDLRGVVLDDEAGECACYFHSNPRQRCRYFFSHASTSDRPRTSLYSRNVSMRSRAFFVVPSRLSVPSASRMPNPAALRPSPG